MNYLKAKYFVMALAGRLSNGKSPVFATEKKRVIVYGETSGWAPAGADKSKICPLVPWVGKIFFHLPSRKTLAQHFAPTSLRDD